jgi:uncharacterized membrane protein
MITPYEVVKFIHILLAITAVGFNVSYSVWLARAARNPEHQAYVLRGVKFLDDRIANPAYGLLLVTGLIMVGISSGLELTTFWVLTSLVLYVVLIGMALTVYTPALRRQVEALEAEGAGSEAYRRAEMRQRVVGIGLAIPALLIVFLMVTKPTL